MKKVLKKIFKWLLSKWKYVIIVIFIIGSLLSLIKYSNNTTLLAIFSGLFGSACVSLVFELLNDINRYRSEKKINITNSY